MTKPRHDGARRKPGAGVDGDVDAHGATPVRLRVRPRLSACAGATVRLNCKGQPRTPDEWMCPRCWAWNDASDERQCHQCEYEFSECDTVACDEPATHAWEQRNGHERVTCGDHVPERTRARAIEEECE
ncbi:MAG: hypothetical protein GY851_00515 [bacterium]|nr:hypothetical protein [bacterium]